MIFETQECEERIGYSFKDKMLLRKCFTHASYSNEHNGENNEVLEFFGDAIIQFVVTEFLVNSEYGDEGILTKKRIDIVSKEPLLNSVKKLGIGQYMLLGKGQGENSSYREKFFSSLYEALVAGIYYDGGIVACKKFIRSTIINDFLEKEKKLKEKNTSIVNKDDKSKLQEYVQKYKLGSISYETLSKHGPDHNPEFRVAVLLNGNKLAEGKGSSKKQAETISAGIALKKIKEDKQG